MVVSGFLPKNITGTRAPLCRGVHGHKLNVGMPVSLQPAHPIHEYPSPYIIKGNSDGCAWLATKNVLRALAQMSTGMGGGGGREACMLTSFQI